MYYSKQYYLPLYATDTKWVKPTRTSRNLSNAVSKKNNTMTKSDVVSLQRLFSVPTTFDPNTKIKLIVLVICCIQHCLILSGTS